MSRVVCRNLSKHFGETVAVNGINLEVEEGEFLVIVGPSGCGKTTTLRMIAGLESISAGEILIDDEVVNKIPPRHRDIAMVFQNYALYPHKKVYDNIAYPLQLRNIPRAEVEKRVTEVSRMLDIEPLLSRRPGQLSGGERQRVALGRAIVRHARLFLMDEPLSNLDAQLRIQMRREIIRLQRQLAITTVYVTHDQVEAMTMGDRIVVMRNGLVQQAGDPMTIYNHPTNEFVARFIGSPPMNLFEGTLEAQDGAIHLRTGFACYRLPPEVQEHLSARRTFAEAVQVVCGIRAEHIAVQLNGGTQPNLTLGTVDLVEPLGSDVFVSLDVASHMLLARALPDLRLHEGQKTSIALDFSKMHFFDPESGNNLVAYSDGV
jgi:multiple sugar transport system ATP-binding protein